MTCQSNLTTCRNTHHNLQSDYRVLSQWSFPNLTTSRAWMVVLPLNVVFALCRMTITAKGDNDFKRCHLHCVDMIRPTIQTSRKRESDLTSIWHQWYKHEEEQWKAFVTIRWLWWCCFDRSWIRQIYQTALQRVLPFCAKPRTNPQNKAIDIIVLWFDRWRCQSDEDNIILLLDCK